MARYHGTTTERGLGWEHAADRKRLLALHRDGDPCWRCGQPMFKWQKLDRDHVVDRVLGGTAGPAVLAHQSCNRSAGARLGNQLRPLNLPRPGAGHDVTCPVCGKVNGRKPRRCEICGAHYHPNHGEQRSCSRACGVVMRRRIYGPSGSRRVAKPKPPPKPRRVAEPYAPRSAVAYYTCRYCGELGVAHGTGLRRREVCPARACQLARLAANNLRTRNGRPVRPLPPADDVLAAARGTSVHRPAARARQDQLPARAGTQALQSQGRAAHDHGDPQRQARHDDQGVAVITCMVTT